MLLARRRLPQLRRLSYLVFNDDPAAKKSKKQESPFDLEYLPRDEGDDSTGVGHQILHSQRVLLRYFRLIEGEMPQLQAYRKRFMPSKGPLVVRTISYGHEKHPVARKRCIVAPVAKLPLKSGAAIHKFKLLAGPRWTPDPPADGGIGKDEPHGQHGYIKIACEDFPEPALNLKWASDSLDRLLSIANHDHMFEDTPHDQRHVASKAKKARRNRGFGGRPSLRDFPPEWLPDTPPVVPTSELPTSELSTSELPTSE